MLNKVMLIGRLGKDPESRNFEDGGLMVSFSLATSELLTGVDGRRIEHTEWHSVVLRNKLAETAAATLGKGRLIYLEGKIRTRVYDQSGFKKYAVEIIGDSFVMLEPREPDNNPYKLGKP